MNLTWAGGSSSVFKSALNASMVSMWTSSMIYTLYFARAGVKNTLYFDSGFNGTLLENVEDDVNSIFIDITTSSALNQKIDVKVRGVTTSFNLLSDQHQIFELVGTYWAVDGNTEIRFSNSDATSEWYSIQFPEIMTTDAMLLEVDETHYTFNGQENKEEELKTQVIAYRSARDYTVGAELVKVVEIKFASVLDNTSGVFNTTINFEASNITDSATVTARIRLNREFEELFVPMQIVKNGKHVLTISYPVLDILQNDNNQIDVYLQIDDGEITIDQGNLLASIVASGLTQGAGFSGEIDVLDIIETINLSEISVDNQTDSVTITKYVPEAVNVSDTVATFTLSEIIYLNGATDLVSVVTVSVPLLRVTENETFDRVTEDGADFRYTESEEV